MKKTLLSIFAFLCLGVFAFGQTFADNFDSYNVGDYLGLSAPEWTTWGNNPGGADDVRITDENAKSGTNSVKFTSTAANGGPADVVLYFGGTKLQSGLLNYGSSMLVETSAYFNLQGEVTIGTTWSMNAFFEANGVGRITGSGNTNILTFNYPENEWFDFAMDINFDANKWTLYIDGECVGSFSNPDNYVASIDIYPTNGNSFFIDDFRYTYSPVAPDILTDAKLEVTASETNGLVGTKTSLKGIFGNEGSTEVTDFTINLDVNGDVTPVTVDGLNLAQGETIEFVIDDEFAILEGFAEVSAEIVSVNSGNFADEDECNNSSRVFLFGSVPAPHKKVIIEEATGTWCGWCPRGTVALERMTVKYPERFIGIAVHDNDPMVNTDYDNGLGATGFPNAKVNRGAFMDPSVIESPFLQEVQEASMTSTIQGADWNAETRELRISLSVTAEEEITSDYKVNVAITEDDVTGTGSDWAQANYYSNAQDLFDIHGTNWRDLPSNVTDLDYDHVARAILAPWNGLADSYPDGLATGEMKIFNFSYTVPEGFDIDKMHIISMTINPNGTLNTGEYNSIADAIENGYVGLTSTHDVTLNNATNVYPNPFSNRTTVSINLTEKTDISLQILDMTGNLMRQKSYGAQAGYFKVDVDATDLPSGMYILKINADDRYTTKRLSVIK